MTVVGEALIDVRGISVRYANGAVGVSDVSLRIEVGQIVALFGPNGAGKTTTVRAMSGFMRSEGARVVSGSVRMSGEEIANLEPHQTWRRGIAVVPERQKVFRNLSVAENLAAHGRRLSRARSADAEARVMRLFPALATRRKEYAGRLSGGQQQMLAIGRGLMSAPRLLIVDEMTLGLHHSMQPPLFDAVREIVKEGTSVLMVDESTGFALRVADHCYLLTGGRTRSDGPAERFVGSELLAAGYVEG